MWQKFRILLKPDPTTAVSARVGVMYQLNQWVRVKDHEVCVTAVEDLRVRPFRLNFDAQTSQAPDLVLQDGTIIAAQPEPDWPRILFVNVAYRNPHTGKTLDCRRNQWVLYDAEGYTYEASGSNDWLYENNGKPFLGGQRYLSPGTKLRGWLAFELKLEIMPERMQFIDGFLKGNTADFLLSTPPHLLPSGR